MNSLYMVKGKVAMSGNLMASKIKSSGKYDYKILEKTTEKCKIEFFQFNHSNNSFESIGTETFTMDDAKAAGLAGGENWRKWPKNMLFNRAISNGYRTFCPDVFSMGPIYTPEELEPALKLDEDGKVIDVAPLERNGHPVVDGEVRTVVGDEVLPSGADLPDAVTTEVHDYEKEPWANPEMNGTDARDMLYATAVSNWGYENVEAIRTAVKAHPKWDGRRLQTIDDIIFLASLLKPPVPESEPE
jgi:hypothetical protein